MKKAKPITFALRLAELLAEKKITAYRLAQIADLPKQTISRFLLGQTEPTFGNVVRIVRALGVSLAAFDCVEEISNRPERKARSTGAE